ncbi:MAG: epoxyqueuosine reductase QueH [Candidatus Muirbacterium halophilum]|nr:epoxyqueuosine reductase QueH [Candidatus Muirbacterium halophilum]MCK9475052.1 epoxyqueuosine reductase QueH [Candidatus Muirbacterium halophilum]
MQQKDIFPNNGEINIKKPNLLIHACCGICLENFLNYFEKSFNITVYWFNPNINGIKEFRKRREVLRKILINKNIKSEYNNFYNVKEFLNKISDCNIRCHGCIEWRLDETVQFAKANGFDVFTTTLLTSPNQDYDYINKYGELLSKKHNIEFLSYDMREDYNNNAVKEKGLYSQGYCGCIFSEEERYK